ncbi:MAG: hypothetical protein AAGA23_02900 [Pseudomonadota bacterium]
MSDAELLELYSEYSQTFTGETSLLISLVFAYVVAMFVAARRLTNFQYVSMASLFALFALSVTMGLRGTCYRAVSLQQEIVRRVQEQGSEISFVATDGFPWFLPELIAALCFAAVIAALVFGHQQRRQPLNPAGS